MRPNQSGSRQYEVVLGDGGMVCELEINPASGESHAPAEKEEAAAEATKRDAKAYLESSGLLPFVQGALQVVAKQQPEDPFAAMARHFGSAAVENSASKPATQKETADSQPANAAPAASPEPAPAVPEAAPAVPAAPAAEAGE